MKKWYFHIGEICIELFTEDNENIELDIPRFQLPKHPKEVVDGRSYEHVLPTQHHEKKVSVRLKCVQEISFLDGLECKSIHTSLAWTEGMGIRRLAWDYFRKHPHMLAEYDLQKPDQIECSIRTEYLPWAITEKYLWAGIGLQYILLHHQHLIFHASYIKCQGRGIIFVAPSGTGKSTQASLWKQHRDAEIINGDKACISVSEHPTVHGIPFDGTSGVCKDVSCPLAAIVLLEQAKCNVVTTLLPAMAIQALFSNVFVDRNVQQEWNKALDLIMQLIGKVPVLRLQCTPDEGAVETLEKALLELSDGLK